MVAASGGQLIPLEDILPRPKDETDDVAQLEALAATAAEMAEATTEPDPFA